MTSVVGFDRAARRGVLGPAWWIAPFGIASLIGLFGFALWLLLLSVLLLTRGIRTQRSAA